MKFSESKLVSKEVQMVINPIDNSCCSDFPAAKTLGFSLRKIAFLDRIRKLKKNQEEEIAPKTSPKMMEKEEKIVKAKAKTRKKVSKKKVIKNLLEKEKTLYEDFSKNLKKKLVLDESFVQLIDHGLKTYIENKKGFEFISKTSSKVDDFLYEHFFSELSASKKDTLKTSSKSEGESSLQEKITNPDLLLPPGKLIKYSKVGKIAFSCIKKQINNTMKRGVISLSERKIKLEKIENKIKNIKSNSEIPSRQEIEVLQEKIKKNQKLLLFAKSNNFRSVRREKQIHPDKKTNSPSIWGASPRVLSKNLSFLEGADRDSLEAEKFRKQVAEIKEKIKHLETSIEQKKQNRERQDQYLKEQIKELKETKEKLKSKIIHTKEELISLVLSVEKLINKNFTDFLDHQAEKPKKNHKLLKSFKESFTRQKKIFTTLLEKEDYSDLPKITSNLLRTLESSFSFCKIKKILRRRDVLISG